MVKTQPEKQAQSTGIYDPVGLELSVAKRWKDEGTFEKSVEQRQGSKPFTFLEGPPTANGKPGIHHVAGNERHAHQTLGCTDSNFTGFELHLASQSTSGFRP